MADEVQRRAGARVLVCGAGGPRVRSESDGVDLLGAAFSGGAGVVAVPKQRLGAGFFRLESGLAGAVVRKFANYGVLLAVLGDGSAELAASSALAAWVRECRRGRQVWFVADLGELDERLAQLP